jgi:GntR family transcriptional regulator
MSRPLPRHIEIAETLIRRIAAGMLADGTRLPTERDMAVDWGVAVGTLRKALAILAGKGLLRRVQGSGNYVRARARVASVYGLFRLELLAGGGLPTAEVLAVEPAGGGTAIRRLRRLDGVPVAVEDILWRGDGVPGAADLSDSLYLTWAECFGVTVTAVEDRVGVGRFPGWSPLSPGAVAGEVERRSWAGVTLVETSTTHFDAGVARFVWREGEREWQSL